MTIKQKKFLNALPNSNSYTEAARKAGYSEKSCRVSANKNIIKYNDFIHGLLVEAKADPKTLGKILNKGLHSENEYVSLKSLQFIIKLLATISKPVFETSQPLKMGELAKAKLKELNARDVDAKKDSSV